MEEVGRTDEINARQDLHTVEEKGETLLALPGHWG